MGSLPSQSRRQIRSICIIGAGPSGLATAKYLLAEKAFPRITILEQRSNVGGLWNYTPCGIDAAKSLSVPQTSPHVDLTKPIWRRNGKEESGRDGRKCEDEPQFLSPLYDRLETNIPRGLMGFSDLDWPQDCPLFPIHGQVLQYIERYAEDVRHLILFRTQVIDVRLDNEEKWRVRKQEVVPSGDGAVSEETFDAVAVASGHFDVPYVPPVRGMVEFNQAHPEVISHSKYYRKPEHYRGKKVIVVGTSASGVDIGAQIASECKSPLLQSQDTDLCVEAEELPAKVDKPRIDEFIVHDRSVMFADGSVATEVDAIVYCTGYLYSFPFLKTVDPPLVTTGTHVENLYQHIFYRPHPTLAFPVLNQRVIPFPMAEAQAAVIARIWSGRLELPSEQDMASWEESTKQQAERSRDLHLLQFPKDADYINMLHDWALSADGQYKESTDELARSKSVRGVNGNGVEMGNGGPMCVGKQPPFWGEKEYWMRARFPAIKKAYQSFGEDRYSRRSLEDVGFDFARWKEESSGKQYAV